MNLILRVLEPGMLQTMLVVAAGMMIPLERRSRSQLRIGVGILAGFLFGGFLSGLDAGRFGVSPSVFYLVEDLLILGLVFLFFVFCTKLSFADCYYAMTDTYVVQHGVVCIWNILRNSVLSVLGPVGSALCGWVLYAALGWPMVYLINKRMTVEGHYRVSRGRAVIMTLVVLLLAMVLPLTLGAMEADLDSAAAMVCEAYAFCACILVLALQLSLRSEAKLLAALSTERRIRQKMQEQYELSRENIDQINRRCHDLRHQIAGLRFMEDAESRNGVLNEIEQSVMIYDTAVKTGNEVLDTVLTEKSLICARNQITWTCMADGSGLRSISPVDLYTVLGNALDNAIESSKKLDVGRRIIRVVVQQVVGGTFIQISNYYDSLVSGSDGHFQTTKEDKENHGFGLTSIEQIVQRYGGTITIETDNGIFHLSILIPAADPNEP